MLIDQKLQIKKDFLFKSEKSLIFIWDIIKSLVCKNKKPFWKIKSLDETKVYYYCYYISLFLAFSFHELWTW